MAKQHVVETLDDDVPSRVIARSVAASRELVDLVLSAPVGDDGRSEWRWFRLPNGNLILGVYPRGDTYFDCEAETSCW